MNSQPPNDPAGESDADVEQAIDDSPINPLTGTVEPEYVLVRDDAVGAEVTAQVDREEAADDLDEAPIHPETGLPEPTLTYVGEDEAPSA